LVRDGSRRRVVSPGDASHSHLEVEGELGDLLGSSFPGMIMRRTNGNTMLVGAVRDESELHGLLNRCLALGLTLVSVDSSPNGLSH
jgi:hypothetical protein